MDRIIKDFKNLCTPALLYLGLSLIALFFIVYQNLGNTNVYCMGDFECYTPSTTAVIISQILYTLFWTWILNLICKDGHKRISWFIVLFPIVLLFVLIGLFMLISLKMTQQKVKSAEVIPLIQPQISQLPIEPGIYDGNQVFATFNPLIPPGPPFKEGFIQGNRPSFDPLIAPGPKMMHPVSYSKSI